MERHHMESLGKGYNLNPYVSVITIMGAKFVMLATARQSAATNAAALSPASFPNTVPAIRPEPPG